MPIAQTLRARFSIGVTEDFSLLSDEALLALALTKPNVFGALIDRYQTQFLSRAQMVVRSRDQAEDVVQETFIRIYRFAPRFKPDEGNFRAWALTILMNVARTHYQRAARYRGYTAPLDPEHYESLADTSDDGKEGDTAYAKEVITKALAKAPKDVAEVLSLAFIEGLPHADIAERLGISSAAVKTRVHRAKAVLRDIINEGNI
jgi:RNA polymerase sigma-70 factor (ECF subfamily)